MPSSYADHSSNGSLYTFAGNSLKILLKPARCSIILSTISVIVFVLING